MASSSASNSDLTRESTQATTDFVEAYYTALQDSRTSIGTYYAPVQPLSDGTSIPDILWNGTSFPDGPAIQKMFVDEMPSHVHYDIHAVDGAVLNPRFSTDANIRADRNFSILVTVNGHVRLEDRKTGPLKDFSETFILVPNVEKAATGAGKGAASAKRNWLIQLQNFRYVVHHHPEIIMGQVTMDVE